MQVTFLQEGQKNKFKILIIFLFHMKIVQHIFILM